MSVFLGGGAPKHDAGVCDGMFALRSPLMTGLCVLGAVVLGVAGVKGGVASGEGGVRVCNSGEVVSNMGCCRFAQSGAGASGML